MTPTEQWIMDLALVYSVPSFFCGIGITLLFVRWPDICRSLAVMPRFLSPQLVFAPKLVFERQDFKTVTPSDESFLPDGLR